jgi:thiamine-phosphate pyrophosphorylase
MPDSGLLRIVDENLDRLAEGLRVMEDLSRMLLNNTELTARLKELRHNLVRADLDFNLRLLEARQSDLDVGEKLEVAGESRTQSLALIALSNARRAQEALRVLEDLAKLPELCAQLDSGRFKSARFVLYTLEKDLIGRLTRREKAGRIQGLYVIIDTPYLGQRDPLEVTRQVLEAGVKVIQLRAKNADKRRLLELAEKIGALCRQYGALFILNDYLDIALAVKADGLHIGQEDLPAGTARRLLPFDAILGVSAATAEEVRAAEAAGADYLGVGAIFPTDTKERIAAIGTARLAEIRAATGLPLAAIGGINSDNISQVMRAGADSACLISAVLGAPDPQEAARQLICKIEAIK